MAISTFTENIIRFHNNLCIGQTYAMHAEATFLPLGGATVESKESRNAFLSYSEDGERPFQFVAPSGNGLEKEKGANGPLPHSNMA